MNLASDVAIVGAVAHTACFFLIPVHFDFLAGGQFLQQTGSDFTMPFYGNTVY